MKDATYDLSRVLTI